MIDILSSGGDPDPATTTRVFWATLEGVIAGVLLVAGGLSGMQAAATITGLPFAVVILLLCAGLYRGLQRYTAEDATAGEPAARPRGAGRRHEKG